MEYAYVKKQIEGSEEFDVNRIDATQIDTYLESGYVLSDESEWVADSTPVQDETLAAADEIIEDTTSMEEKIEALEEVAPSDEV